ncbi:MAG TPA: A24 family peptidase [Vicinamibacterales bacterium]|nr:A24 family peptidase [Vicinamibacterales bacterium]
MAAIAAGGASSTAIDLRTRRIPNVLTGATALAGLAAAAFGIGAVTLPQAIAGLLVGFFVMLPGHVVGATGAGDVKLFAALGTFLGPGGALLAFFYTALAGGALAVAVAVHRRMLRDTVARAAALVSTGGSNAGEIETIQVNRFAYAPAIAIGALAVALGF